jgi:N4-gp56 family major capsid protein
MPLNTTSTVNTGTGANATKPAAFYDKQLLKLFVQNDFTHGQWAQKRPMPKKTGDTINFRKIAKLTVNTTPLTEGTPPTGDNASISAISVSTKQYGRFMEFSDLVDIQQVDPIIAEYNKEQGRIMRETLDVLVRDELAAGTQVAYAGGKASRATLAAGDKPTIALFRKARLALKNAHVKPASGGDYIVLITPAVTEDLLDDAQFLKAYEIAQNAKPLFDGEIARVYGLRFVEVVNGKVFAAAGTGGVNVHASIVLGEQAYGITTIQGEGDVKSIVKALGSSGVADPLNQKQSIGVKVNAFVAKRLAEEAIWRVESVPTSN